VGIATVVKDKVGRNRYIAFQVEGGDDLEMGDMIRALREAFSSFPQDTRPWLVLFQQGQGVVKCSHLHKDDVIRVLQSIRRVGEREVRIRTLGTSGTVRKTVRKYLGGVPLGRQRS
jgi:RNase P/RNase MRP subunit POP5